MKTLATILWLTAASFVAWFGFVCFLKYIWAHNPKRQARQEVLYQEYQKRGQAPPPPASLWQLFWALQPVRPMTLFFLLAIIAWTLWWFGLALVSVCCAITRTKNPFDRPQPPISE